MERKPEIQYIDRFYVHGSEARVLELKPMRRFIKTVLPKAVPDHSIRIAVDPIALCGIVVAVAMLVCIVMGCSQYVQAYNTNQAMLDYVITLQNENVELTGEYESSYDLEDIRQKAMAIGMVPRSEAQVVSIHVEVPQPEPEMNIWATICWHFHEFFA